MGRGSFWLIFLVFAIAGTTEIVVSEAMSMSTGRDNPYRFPAILSAVTTGFIGVNRYKRAHGPLWLGASTAFIAQLSLVGIAVLVAFAILPAGGLIIAAAVMTLPLKLVTCVVAAVLLSLFGVVPTVAAELRWFFSNRP
jgi:hypothetical protein